MLKDRLETINNRIDELTNEGNELCLIAKPTNKPNVLSIQDVERLAKWKINLETFLLFLFKDTDFRYKEFLELKKTLHFPSSIKILCSQLNAIKDDINKGFLFGYEFSFISNLCNDILTNAQNLNNEGYKVAAAIYVRIAIETTLKKVAEKNGINIEQKASIIKTELYKKQIIDQSQMNLIQSWLDIGNFAAHGKDEFKNYDKKQIDKIIGDTNVFVGDILK